MMENDFSLTEPAANSELQGKIVTGLAQQMSATNPPVNENNSVWSEYNIEILNTMTASHINLRKERDTLVHKIECLTKSNTQLQEELLLVQQDNKWQLSEIEDLRNKKIDADDQWKKSFLDLTEQHERKKSILRGMNKKVQVLVKENRNLHQQNAAQSAQIKSKYDNRDRVLEELNNLREVNDNLKNDMKSTILKMENELADARNKELQIRRIAKKYKDAFYALEKSDAEREADLTINSRRGDTPDIGSSPLSIITGSTSPEIVNEHNVNELLYLSPTIKEGTTHHQPNASEAVLNSSQETKEQIDRSSLTGSCKRSLNNSDDAVTPTIKKTRSNDANQDES